MIYVRLAGGLGNQLYQLAAAAFLSHQGDTPVRVVPFVEGLNRYDEPRTPDSIELLRDNDWLLPPATPVPGWLRRLTLDGRAGRWLPFLGVSDRNLWDRARHASRAPLIVDGYFQHGWSESTFSAALARMAVRPVDASVAARLERHEAVIHIRGGDFLKLPQFQVVHAPFYVEAIRQARDRGHHHFAVMTDDPVYATQVCDAIKAVIPQVTLRLLPRAASALEDFDTLRSASARIIGNSTFAWWATALGTPHAATWAPTKLTIDEPRDFYLANEIAIKDTEL